MNNKIIPFHNKKLNKLINVYQLHYKNSERANGLGDFIRGSFYLLQIAIRYNLRFDIDYSNHPISKFLTKHVYTDEQYTIDYSNVEYYFPDNLINTTIDFYNNFITYLNNVDTRILCLNSNNLPIGIITEFQRQFIKNKFIPNENLNKHINLTMNNLNILPQQFSVIHIRSGDKYILHNNQINNNVISNINNILFNIFKLNLNNPTIKYLLLSDCNTLKLYLKKQNPALIIGINEITHLGESKVQSDNSIINTLTDFFIMSKSNNIYAMSPYEHGSGFSEYCSKIFNIPYTFCMLNIPT